MNSKKKTTRVLLILLAVSQAFVSIDANATLKGDEIQAQLLPVTQSGPDRLTVRIKIKIKPGWHVYGVNPGEMGLPPKLSLRLTEGLIAGETEWPADHKFEMGEYRCAGYSDDFVVNTSVKIADLLKAKKDGSAMISMSWLACDGETCVPGKVELNVPLVL